MLEFHWNWSHILYFHQQHKQHRHTVCVANSRTKEPSQWDSPHMPHCLRQRCRMNSVTEGSVDSKFQYIFDAWGIRVYRRQHRRCGTHQSLSKAMKWNAFHFCRVLTGGAYIPILFRSEREDFAKYFNGKPSSKLCLMLRNVQLVIVISFSFFNKLMIPFLQQRKNITLCNM